MIWIDIVLLIIILWFAFKGFSNGFILEITSFIAIVLASCGALKYKNFTIQLLQDYLKLEGSYVTFLSLVITFLVILLAVTFIGKLITQTIEIAQLGILNRILGLLFGTLKIGIILSLIVSVIDKINTKTEFINQETINNSYLYHSFNDFSKIIYQFSDEHFDEVKNTIEEKLDTIEGSTTV